MVGPLGDAEQDIGASAGKDGTGSGDIPGNVFLCRLCGRNIERFFTLGSLFCPYCGAALNPEAVPGRYKKDSNPISGRAFWSTGWSILAVIIGMGFLIGVTLVISVIIIVPFVISDPDAFLSDPDALEGLIMAILGNPYATVLLSLSEFSLLLVPLLLVKKYQKPVGKRLQLLGWRPYRVPDVGATKALSRLARDLLVASTIAIAMVGFQFLLTLGNDAFWSLFVPIDPLQETFSKMDQSLVALDPFQLLALTGAMILVIGPTEEFLFRGYTQQGLEARLGERKALFITAVLFTVVHIIGGLIQPLISLYLFMPYFGLSLVFCEMYRKTKNLNLLIFIHGIYDAMLVVYAYIMSLSIATSMAFVIVSFVACGAGFVYVIRNFIREKNASRNMTQVVVQ